MVLDFRTDGERALTGVMLDLVRNSRPYVIASDGSGWWTRQLTDSSLLSLPDREHVDPSPLTPSLAVVATPLAPKQDPQCLTVRDTWYILPAQPTRPSKRIQPCEYATRGVIVTMTYPSSSLNFALSPVATCLFIEPRIPHPFSFSRHGRWSADTSTSPFSLLPRACDFLL